MIRTCTRAGFVGVALAATLVYAHAQPISCTLDQVTDIPLGGASPVIPHVDGAGQRIAFLSSRDITGGNPDLSHEIFVVDISTGAIAQVTDHDALVDELVLSGDGRYVAYTSSDTLLGTFGLFRASVDSGATQQLTPDSSAGTGSISIDTTGRTISFSSRQNLTGGNPFSEQTLFVWRAGGTFRQLSDGSQPAVETAVSGSGHRIAHREFFDSAWRLYKSDGHGASGAEGNEVVLSNGTSIAISRDGSTIVFVSTDDQLYARRPLQSSTELVSSNALRHNKPASNAAGTRVAFERTDGFTPRIVVIDPVSSEEHSISLGAHGQSPTIDDSGITVAFASNADLTGDNLEGNLEVFVATCSAPAARTAWLTLDASDAIWNAAVGASSYDVVSGDVGNLLSSNGDFSVATDSCLADDLTSTQISHGPDPAAGSASWYLVRMNRGAVPQTYDSSGTIQAAPRDSGIAAFPGSCS